MTSRNALDNWNFVYVGNNPKQWAADMGMAQGNTMGYEKGHEHRQMDSLSKGIDSARAAVSRGDLDAIAKAKMEFFKQG